MWTPPFLYPFFHLWTLVDSVSWLLTDHAAVNTGVQMSPCHPKFLSLGYKPDGWIAGSVNDFQISKSPAGHRRESLLVFPVVRIRFWKNGREMVSWLSSSMSYFLTGLRVTLSNVQLILPSWEQRARDQPPRVWLQDRGRGNDAYFGVLTSTPASHGVFPLNTWLEFRAPSEKNLSFWGEKRGRGELFPWQRRTGHRPLNGSEMPRSLYYNWPWKCFSPGTLFAFHL